MDAKVGWGNKKALTFSHVDLTDGIRRNETFPSSFSARADALAVDDLRRLRGDFVTVVTARNFALAVGVDWADGIRKNETPASSLSASADALAVNDLHRLLGDFVRLCMLQPGS